MKEKKEENIKKKQRRQNTSEKSCGHANHGGEVCTQKDCILEHEGEHSRDACTHAHMHGHECGCGENHQNEHEGCDCCEKRLTAEKFSLSWDKIASIAIGVILLIVAMTVPCDYPYLIYIAALLAVGWDFMLKAIKNVLKGKIFDENLLMIIASCGAYGIGEFAEGLAVMLLYKVGEIFQDYAVVRSRKSITDLMGLKAEKANRITKEGVIETVASELLQTGDEIYVGYGEKVPTDAVLIENGSSFDYTSLTGESAPVSLEKGEEVLGGSVNMANAVRMQVSKEFKDTAAAKIAELIEQAKNAKPKSEKIITKFAKYYTPAVVLAALIIAFVPPIFSGYADFAQYAHMALTFLVISCPCALVISVPLTFFAGVGGASRKGVLVKGSNYLEALKKIDTVVMDKTGTLTEGVFEVKKVEAVSGAEEELLKLAAHAEAFSSHPIAASLKSAYAKTIDTEKIEHYEEIGGGGVKLFYNGKEVLCGNKKFLLSRGIDVQAQEETHTAVYLAVSGEYAGRILIGDKLRKESKETVAYLKRRNIRVIMMSGDNEAACESTARDLGIEEYYGKLLPQDKAEKVMRLTEGGASVLFVGDGTNDAPVLKSAAVGACMGGTFSQASIESADIVLEGGVAALKNAFMISDKTMKLVKENIALSLSVKVAIMIACIFYPNMWLAIISDVGVSLLAVLNALRAGKIKR